MHFLSSFKDQGWNSRVTTLKKLKKRETKVVFIPAYQSKCASSHFWTLSPPDVQEKSLKSELWSAEGRWLIQNPWDLILTFHLSDQHTAVTRPESQPAGLPSGTAHSRDVPHLLALDRFGRTSFVLSPAGCLSVFAVSSLLNTFMNRNIDIDTLHGICVGASHPHGLASYSSFCCGSRPPSA